MWVVHDAGDFGEEMAILTINFILPRLSDLFALLFARCEFLWWSVVNERSHLGDVVDEYELVMHVLLRGADLIASGNCPVHWMLYFLGFINIVMFQSSS